MQYVMVALPPLIIGIIIIAYTNWISKSKSAGVRLLLPFGRLGCLALGGLITVIGLFLLVMSILMAIGVISASPAT